MAMANKSISLQSWSIFINSLTHPTPYQDTLSAPFPKKQILTFLTKQQCPSLKELLAILPLKYTRYRTDPALLFRQIIILLYVIIVKGCNNRIVYQIVEEILTELLRYRVLVILSHQGRSQIVEVYYYLDEWLSLVIPKLLGIEGMMSKIIVKSVHEGVMGKSVKDIKLNNGNIDAMMSIFHAQLISKISDELTQDSLQQFILFLQQTYPPQYQPILLKTINPDLPTQQHSIIDLQYFCLLRQTQSTPFIQHLQISTNPQNKLILQLQTADLPDQHKNHQWVMEAYYQKPQSISHKITQMKNFSIMEVYRFLMRLEIYGGSPKIQVLNDFIVEKDKITEEDADQFLEFFSRFLMGEKLGEQEYSYGDRERDMLIDECLRKIRVMSNVDQILISNEIAAQACCNLPQQQ